MKIIKWLIACLIITMPLASFSTLRPFTNKDCAALAMPKTVLLVHAAWCSHCRTFKPIYEQISNQEKYKDWVFYEMENNNFAKVCGTSIHAVPIIFKNNMKDYQLGSRPQLLLEKFLDN